LQVPWQGWRSGLSRLSWTNWAWMREKSFVDDLGADSLDTVELVMAFEEAFDVEIPDEDAEKIRTVKDAVDYINAHAKGKPA